MTRSTPGPTGSDSIIALSRRSEGVLQHIPLQSGHPSRALGPKFLIMQALFQLHEADAGLRRQTAIATCKAMDQPDPYQERAREMAREAGLDPDGRIDASNALSFKRVNGICGLSFSWDNL